ncbi:MAG TPA: type I-U CRISPR-associated RAMP protein Csb1/Cas7u [Thermoleophilia bacterium]|nr:type I-U CRISPR-associated RAMP protein Csb1/Cas7u [Thermoleophilia bacterium]
MAITLGQLHDVVAKDAAVRRVRRLLPVGGTGDRIFPPTYPAEAPRAPARHVFETRRIEGKDVPCVLIDSVQSQANRLEEALRRAMSDGAIAVPHIRVDFAGQTAKVEDREYDLSDLGTITSLDAPHRVFDAIIRDSELDGSPFSASDLSERLRSAKPHDATAIFEASPTALLFGAWNSHGEGGGLGAKFARCIVSEIVGVNAIEGQTTSSRIDPLGIRAEVRVRGGVSDWQIAQDGESRRGTRRPSEIGHSNIMPDVAPGGVTMDYALHTAVVTCAGLRRLRFPDTEDENAGRTVLAALALVALTQQDETGYALRSRCDLVCEGAAPFEIVHPDGAADQFEATTESAIAVFNEAVEVAKQAGFPWREEPIRLVPQKRLAELVAHSRARALAGESEGNDSGESA